MNTENIQQLIINALSAKEQGLTKYFTGQPCSKGHISERWVSTHVCCVCTAEKAKLWRQSNSQHRKQYRSTYRANHLEQEQKNSMSYRNTHKTHINEQRKLDYHNNPVKYMLYRAKERATKLNIPFNLSVVDITIPDKCPVFGMQFIIGDYDLAPSLDRIVPSLGYVKGNVVVVSAKANRIKNDATIAELGQVLSFYTTSYPSN